MTASRNSSDTTASGGIIGRLEEASIITDDTEGDLTLTDDFRTVWRRRIEHVRERDLIELLALLLDADPDELTLDADDSGVTVTRAGHTVGEWPSEAAIIADVAAFFALGDQLPEWDDLDGDQRDELVARLRVFLNACPSCGGELTEEISEESVPKVVCMACGARLF